MRIAQDSSAWINSADERSLVVASCRRTLIAIFLVASVASTLSVYPHQLTYFNELSGGPANGYKHLLHSNVDWGQDGVFAREWLIQNERLSHDPTDPSSYRVEPAPIARAGLTDYRSNWEIISVNEIVFLDSSPLEYFPATHIKRIGYTQWAILKSDRPKFEALIRRWRNALMHYPYRRPKSITRE